MQYVLNPHILHLPFHTTLSRACAPHLCAPTPLSLPNHGFTFTPPHWTPSRLAD